MLDLAPGPRVLLYTADVQELIDAAKRVSVKGSPLDESADKIQRKIDKSEGMKANL